MGAPRGLCIGGIASGAPTVVIVLSSGRCTEGRNNAWPAGRAMRSVNSSYGAERCIEGVHKDFTTAMRRVGLDPVRPVWLGEFFA